MHKRLLVPVIMLLLFGACGNPSGEPKFVNIRGLVFGTHYSVSYYCKDGKNYVEQIDSVFNVINQSMSYYVPNSTISKINRNETEVMDDHFLTVLQKSLEIARDTKGAFDPTISPLVNAWGFGFEKRQRITNALLDSLKSITGYERIQILGNRVRKEIPEIQFDFNAIAKGYAVDIAGKFLESKGITSYMVEIGGDLVTAGLKADGTPWRIGLERPAPQFDAPQHWDYLVEMHDRAVATSGSTRNYYEQDGQRYSHTIDPVTGRPVAHTLLSVSVFANDCMTADGLATAFMVMGMERALSFLEGRPDLQAFFIYATDTEALGTYKTEGLEVVPRSEI